MSALKHFESLEHKHDILENQIHDAYLHHASDEELKKLKRMKLRLREQLEFIRKK